MRDLLKMQGVSFAGGVLCYCWFVLVCLTGCCSSERGSPLTLGLLGTSSPMSLYTSLHGELRLVSVAELGVYVCFRAARRRL